jgi:hypothetical protein
MGSDPSTNPLSPEPPLPVYEQMQQLMVHITNLHQCLDELGKAQGLAWWHTEDIQAFDRILGMFATRLLVNTPFHFWQGYAERLAEMHRQGLWTPKE